MGVVARKRGAEWVCGSALESCPRNRLNSYDFSTILDQGRFVATFQEAADDAETSPLEALSSKVSNTDEVLIT